MTTTRNLEIAPPNKPSDNSSKPSGDGVEPLSVKFPTTTEERDSWKTDLASMHASNKGTADSVLPPFSLTSNDQMASLSSGKDNPGVVGASDKPGLSGGRDNSGVLVASDNAGLAGAKDNPVPPGKIDRDGDGKADNPDGPTSAVLDQLAKLQKQEQEGLRPQKNGDEDTEGDTGALEDKPNSHAYQHNARVEKANSDLKKKNKLSDISQSADIRLDQISANDDSSLLITALRGDAVSGNVAPHKVSIFELKVRKETDGRVVLTAPAGDKDHTEEVAVVQDHGKPVSAMELGKYLRPDGTLLIGEQGQVLRPGEELEAKALTKTDGKTGTDSASMEKTLVNENKDQELISMTALDVIDGRNASILIPDSDLIAASDLIAESDLSNARTNPLNMNPINLEPLDLEMHRTEIAKDLNSESRLHNSNASDQIRSPEVSIAQDDTPEHRTIKTRLGETYRSIALRDLNDVKKWPLIAALNNHSTGVNDKGVPIAVLQKGTTLLLPNASEIEAFQATQVVMQT